VPLFLGYVLFAIFQIPVAVAQNVETIMLGRFFGGLFASAPLAVVGGALADMWDPVERAYAVCAFAGGTFIGPVLGPIIGGFVTQSHLGWRWYVLLLFSCCLIFVFRLLSNCCCSMQMHKLALYGTRFEQSLTTYKTKGQHG